MKSLTVSLLLVGIYLAVPTTLVTSESSDPDALQVVVLEDDHTFTMNEKNLKRILLDPRVKDNKVIMLSVAGAFRTGKSLLLDFFLRYLYAKGAGDWPGSDSEPLKGFPWKCGAERHTSGILMWSDPFEVILSSGEKASVLLMDTQGTFDSQSTVKDCATVFALSTLLSSTLIYNIKENIKENDLQHLQYFTDYARLAMKETQNKPFQDVYVLVRDWPHAHQHEYGFKGGDQILEQRLKVVDGQHSELQELRRHIRASFNKIGCYLMPHPGLKVANSPHFDGRLSDITEDFRIHMKEFIDGLLKTDSLVVKEFNGQPITGQELFEYFKRYVALFQSDALPEPKTMLQATAEANNLAAIATAKDRYTTQMEQICGGDQPYVKPDRLLAEHTRCMKAALEQFNSAPKMGGAEFSQSYAARLNKELERYYESCVKHNHSKSMFAGMQTPGVLFIALMLACLLSSVFYKVGLNTLSSIFNITMMLLFVISAGYVYIKTTGNYSYVGAQVDNVVSTAWQFAVSKIFRFV